MDSNVASSVHNLITAAEVRDTTMMLMQTNANWEEYLTPAPLSILIMAELVFISSNDDFSISKNPPPGGFKYIRYPDSFRACLMQVCNSGWDAFNKAHKHIDQIRIHTATVPNYMKEAVKILFNGSDEDIETLLPLQLEQICTIADECEMMTSDVENQYTDVINLIQEMLEACMNALNHFNREELEMGKMKLETIQTREKSSTEVTEWSKKAMEAMSKQIDEALNMYKKSMETMPSGWDMRDQTTVQDRQQHTKTEDENVDLITQMKVYSKSGEILSAVESLKKYVNKNGIDWKELYDQKNKCTKTTVTQSQLQRISEELEKMTESKLSQHVLLLCKRGINICNDFATYSPEKMLNEKITKQLIKEIEELHDDVLRFDSDSKTTLKHPAFNAIPPTMPKAESNSPGLQSASQRAAENTHFRIEQSRNLYEKSVENMKWNQKELTEFLVEMQTCKVKEIDFDTTIKMLVKGVDAMGRVEEQWQKMVGFFQMVSNSLGNTMDNFVQTANETKKLSYDSELFAKYLLYNQAFQASNIASLVHMISGTYTEVSNKYLMDKVSSLGKLMAMDKKKPEFMQERLKLHESCQEAQDGILQLVLKNNKEFERKTDARIAELESGLKAILPAAPQERIQKNTEDGFDEEDTGLDESQKWNFNFWQTKWVCDWQPAVEPNSI
ncbi:hypothetical protein AALO_G00001750 [Alosa alosa]|uniref:Uncharacterized protein n=1 Tax=Alosa alosa TaxID=278164 RepID=A0AAV6HHE1_9TELE|nr:uncharacterized protein LOC125303792 [Alosa alosa]KAG5285297.1 hypothetical protein AALO_G00001750 [Alosa alosa]